MIRRLRWKIVAINMAMVTAVAPLLALAAGAFGIGTTEFIIMGLLTQVGADLGISIPVGKDSLSMRTQWSDAGQARKVVSPVSLIATAFATLPDVRGTLTPQLNAQEEDSSLVLVDLGRGKNRMAGSILGQVLGQSGDAEIGRAHV